MSPIRALLISDFNVQNLANHLGDADEPPRFTVTSGPFGQATPNAFVLDAARWHLAAGKGSFNARLWFTGKVPSTKRPKVSVPQS